MRSLAPRARASRAWASRVACVAFASPVVWLLSCTTLPSLSSGVCGNGVVEPDNHEDCDTFASGGATSCRAPGTLGACRFDCSASADSTHACPPGYGCGKDALCRTGTGKLGPVATVASPDAAHLSTGDFDGDGRDDVVADSPLDIRIHYFDEQFALGTSLRLPLQRSHATVARLPDQTRANLVITDSGGIDLWHGRDDRTVAPTVFPAFPIPGTSVRLIAVEALPLNPGLELFLVGGDPTGTVLARVTAKNSQPDVLFGIAQPPEQIAGDVLVASFLEGSQSPCDEIAMAFSAESRVHVFTPCRAGANGTELNKPPHASGDLPQIILPEVTVPGSEKITAMRTARVNADAHLDLLIATTNGNFIAYGVGDGTFNSSLPVPPSNGNSTAAAFTFTVVGDPQGRYVDFPLAAADLDGDNLADFVLPKAIVFSRGDGSYVASVFASSAWKIARIADLTGNGIRDVIAASGATLDFYNGTGTRLLNHASYPAAGAVGLLSVGDVDGDLVGDVVFRAAGTPDDAIEILFGRALAYPDAPAIIGRLPSITEITAGAFEQSLVNENQSPDLIADIAVVSKGASGLTVSALAGRADRQLTSPFFLVNGKDINNDRALSAQACTVGRFANEYSGVGALAYDVPSDATQALGNSRLWHAPLSNADAVQTSDILPVGGALPTGLDYGLAPQLVAVDLDDPSAGGFDDLVLAAAPLASGAKGSLFAARLVNGAWVVDALPLGSGSGFREWRMRACDVDGDGARDVVVLYGDGTNGARKVTVFFNTKSGKLDPSAAVDVPLPDGDAAVVGFACANLDRDVASEIVLLTARAAYLAKLDTRARSYSSPSAAIASVQGGVAIASGDLDADGVVDLAIANAGAVNVYAGSPAVR